MDSVQLGECTYWPILIMFRLVWQVLSDAYAYAYVYVDVDVDDIVVVGDKDSELSLAVRSSCPYYYE